MTIFHAALLGIVEGLTEFLPISSTAHLIIVSNLLKLPQTDFQKFFEVFIQGGAILAVLLLYVKYVLTHKYLIKDIIFSFFPTGIVGFFLYKIIKNIFFESNSLIIWALFVVGLAFVFLEYWLAKKPQRKTKKLASISPFQAVCIGLTQSLAVIPGVSRSGIVMFFMMISGYRRDESALYSFLLAVPTLVAASGYDLFKMRSVILSSSANVPLIIVGTITSFVTAYFVMKWFISFLKTNSLAYFGIYRVALAIILLFILK